MATTVKSLLVRIGCDIAEFQRGMTESQKKMKEFGSKMKNVGMTLTKAVTLPIVGLGVAAFKTSVDFNKAMANIATLIPGNVKRLAELKRGIQDLAIETGKSTGDIAEGCYHVISAFGDTADTMRILEICAKSATAGLATTKDSLDLVSVVMKNFGDISGDAAMLVMDLAFGAVKLGQCVTGDTRIILSDGSYKRIDELEGGGRVIAYDGRGFVPMQARWIDQGTKPTVTLGTRLGREIATTWNHPYLTKVRTRDRRSTKDPEWKKVSDLNVGDKIAIPTSMPFFGNKKVSEEDAALLGLWLAEGACKSSSPRISSTRYGDDIKAFALKKGCSTKNIEKREGKCPVWEITANAKGHPNGNPVQAFLRNIGLGECSSASKHIPEEVFTWNRESLAIFLRWLFNGDGWLYTKKRKKNGLKYQIGFVSKSERLVRDVSHLLLRFGIIGRVRERENKWCWETQRGFEIARFLDFIGIDRPGADVFRKHKPPHQIKPFGVVEFDAILSIEEGKPRHVYDLAVRELHNFVANDIVAHNTTFPELAYAIQGVASMAKTLNMSQEELFTTFATFTGVTGDATKASTQLRAVMNSLLKATPALEAAMGKLGFTSAQTMVAEMGLFSAVRALIGTTDGLAESVSELFPNIRGIGLVLASSGAQAGTFEEKLAKIKVMFGAMLEAYKEQTEGINILGFTWSVLKTLVVVVSQALGDALAPAFKAIIKVMIPVAELIRKLIGWFGSLPGPIRIIAASIAGAAAAFGPLLMIVGAVITMLPTLGMALTVLTGPIGIIAAAIAGLVAVGLIVVSEWDKIKGFFVKLWTGISGFFDTTAGKIVAACVPVIGLPVMIIKHWKAITGFFSALWRKIWGFFDTTAGRIVAACVPVIGLPVMIIKHWKAIVEFFSALWGKIWGFFDTTAGKIFAICSPFIGLPVMIAKHWKEIPVFFSALWKTVSEYFATAFDDIKKLVVTVWSGISGFFTSVFEGIKGTVTNVWNDISGFFVNIFETIKGTVSEASGAIAGIFSKMFKWLKNAASSVLTAVVNFVVDKLQWLMDQIAKIPIVKKFVKNLQEGLAAAKAAVASAKDKVAESTEEMADEIDKSGERIKQTYKGIGGVAAKVMEKLVSLHDTMADELMRATMSEYEYAKWAAQKKYEERKTGLEKELADGKTGMEKIYNARKEELEKEIEKKKATADDLLDLDKAYADERMALEKVVGDELLLLKKAHAAETETIEKAAEERRLSLRTGMADALKRFDMDEVESARLTAEQKKAERDIAIAEEFADGAARAEALKQSEELLQAEITAIENAAAEEREEERKRRFESYLDLRRSLTDSINQMTMSGRDYALSVIEQEYNDTVNYAESLKDAKVISAEEANDMILDAGDKRRLMEEAAEKEHARAMMDNFFAVGQAVSNLFSQIGALAQTSFDNQLAALESETEATRVAADEQYEAEREAIDNSLMSEQEKYFAMEKLEKDKNEAFAKLEQDAEKKRKAIQKKAFETQKKISLVTAAINIAEAVTKAFTGGIPPFNFILGALVAAAGLVQLAAIAGQKFPSAEKGAWLPKPMLIEAGHRGGEVISPVPVMKEAFRETMAETIPLPNRFYIDLTTIIGTDRFKQSVVKVVNEASDERQLKIKHWSVVE